MHLTKKHTPKAYMKMPQQDMHIGMQVLTGNGYKFLSYMYSRPEQSMFDPDKVARVMGVTKRTVGSVFKELQECGFMYIEHNKSHELCVLGLQAVDDYKKSHGLYDHE